MTEPTMAFDDFALVPMTSDDLPLIVKWRSRPEVHEWYAGRPVTEDEIRTRHLESTDPVTRCVVHFEGEPIGHLQFYEYIDEWKPAVDLSPDRGLGTGPLPGRSPPARKRHRNPPGTRGR